MKPRIAVPHWRAPTWERTKYYYDSLAAAGAEYVVVSEDSLPAVAHGLLLTGGVDVNPRLYGEKRHPRTERSNRKRDEHELRLLRQALERDLPVLSICRGHQLLNVAFGGSLVQDIESNGHKWLPDSTSSWHAVSIAPGSRLAGIYGPQDGMRVNSRHHQGITAERVGAGLVATAISPDGLVEGLESGQHRWVIGVQWHPERPEMRPEAERLFAAFVQACWG